MSIHDIGNILNQDEKGTTAELTARSVLYNGQHVSTNMGRIRDNCGEICGTFNHENVAVNSAAVVFYFTQRHISRMRNCIAHLFYPTSKSH